MSAKITNKQLEDFENILLIQKKSPNTIQSYLINIKKLISFLNGADLSAEKMYEYKGWLIGKGFKTRTVNAYLATANFFCETTGHPEMKVSLISLEYEDSHKKSQISSADYKKLVFTALQNEQNRLAMMIQVLCLIDIRFNELSELTIDALNKGYIVVSRGKRNSIYIELPERVISDLKKYAGQEQIVSGIIFRTENGNLVDRSNFRKDIKKLCVLAGVEEEFGSIQHIKNVVIDEYPYFGLKSLE